MMSSNLATAENGTQAVQRTNSAMTLNLKQLLTDSRIDLKRPLQSPPICLERIIGPDKFAFVTLGDFSLVIGKAKSRKTFFITSMLAAALDSNKTINSIKASLPPSKRVCLYFDTEQSGYHAQITGQRVLKLAGMSDSANFCTYGLRKYSPKERLRIIDHAIYSTKNLGFVVIDGIRDLVSSINDEDSATVLSSYLLKWSEEQNIHIMCVLHQNKSDNNARGHLGTELQNKAETVISITKDTKNGEISKVEVEMGRDMGFKSYAFSIDSNGLPKLESEFLSIEPQRSSKCEPTDFSDEKHKNILGIIFSKEAELKYKELQTSVIETFSKQGDIISQSRFRDFLKYYLEKKLIQQTGVKKTRSSKYTMSSLLC